MAELYVHNHGHALAKAPCPLTVTAGPRWAVAGRESPRNRSVGRAEMDPTIGRPESTPTGSAAGVVVTDAI